jgi:hypothetical protein
MAPKPKPRTGEAADTPASAPDDVSVTGARRPAKDDRRRAEDDQSHLETFEQRVDRTAGSAHLRDLPDDSAPASDPAAND